MNRPLERETIQRVRCPSQAGVALIYADDQPIGRLQTAPPAGKWLALHIIDGAEIAEHETVEYLDALHWLLDAENRRRAAAKETA